MHAPESRDGYLQPVRRSSHHHSLTRRACRHWAACRCGWDAPRVWSAWRAGGATAPPPLQLGGQSYDGRTHPGYAIVHRVSSFEHHTGNRCSAPRIVPPSSAGASRATVPVAASRSSRRRLPPAPVLSDITPRASSPPNRSSFALLVGALIPVRHPPPPCSSSASFPPTPLDCSLVPALLSHHTCCVSRVTAGPSPSSCSQLGQQATLQSEVLLPLGEAASCASSPSVAVTAIPTSHDRPYIT